MKIQNFTTEIRANAGLRNAKVVHVATFIKKQTEKAIQAGGDDNYSNVWIPKSQVKNIRTETVEASEAFINDEIEMDCFEMPAWLYCKASDRSALHLTGIEW